MRRRLLCFAMFPGLVLPSPLVAVTYSHCSSRSPQSSQWGKATRTHAAAPGSKSHPASSATLRRALRKPSHLRLAEPAATALIDPVPLGKFPPPAPLRGSHDSLVRQNVRSQEDGLTRIQDDADLLLLRRDGELVALPATASLTVDERLPANRRYCRAWTAQFLSDLSRVHYGRFRQPLQVNSAVRTVEYQRHLQLVNGNAAPAEGDDASPHLTGATIDIAKKGLSMNEVGWMRAYLTTLEEAGKIDVEEEFYQSCFHITVYRSYRPEAPVVEAKAQANPRRGGSASLLASRVR